MTFDCFNAGPLIGVVVYVAKKLEHLQSEIHKIVTGLGGQIRYQVSWVVEFLTCGCTISLILSKKRDSDPKACNG